VYWLYGSLEQYGQALLWSIIPAHAPMTRGEQRGYWAKLRASKLARINTFTFDRERR
jgi:hypothetical protein